MLEELKLQVTELEARLARAESRRAELDAALREASFPRKPPLRYIIRDGWLEMFESDLPCCHMDDMQQGVDCRLGYLPWDAQVQVMRHRQEQRHVEASFGVLECGSSKVSDCSKKFLNLSSKVKLAEWVRTGGVTTPPICPESGWIRWDLEFETLEDFVSYCNSESLERGSEFLVDIRDNASAWVMKRDGASGGSGIVFVSSLKQVKQALDEGRKMEEALPFLDDRYDLVPHWAVQRHIDRPLLLMDGHKFHLRAYIVVVRDQGFIYDSMEIRVAPAKWKFDFSIKGAHITNGGGNQEIHERRYVLDEFPDLRDRVYSKVMHMLEFALLNAEGEERPDVVSDESWYPCTVMGVDIMVDEDYELYMLEGNHSPAAPPFDDPSRFGCHCRRFVQRLIRLLVIAGADDLQEHLPVPGFKLAYSKRAQ